MLRRLWQRYVLWLDKRRLRRNIGTVREAMGLLGYSIEHLADEDIITGCDRIAEAGAASGLTMAEATLAFAMAEATARKPLEGTGPLDEEPQGVLGAGPTPSQVGGI